MTDSIDGPTDLYRYYDADDRLLYVGISFSAVARASQHRQDKGWWPDVAKMTVEHLPNRGAALSAEMDAIASESPMYNVIGNGKTQQQPPPWRCHACRAPVGRFEQDGFIQLDHYQKWECVCVKCDQELRHHSKYWIDAKRIKTIADIERWTWHLSDKNWFEVSSWERMLKKSSAWPEASTKAFLAYDAWRDERNRRLSVASRERRRA